MLRRFLLDCDKGTTIAELLIASLVGVVLVSLTHSVIVSNHELYQYDIERTELNQNLRSALDIVAANAREAGERLPSSFPALEIIDGGASPDQLVIRRNLIDEVLVVCQDLASGSSNSWVFLSSAAATNPACTYPSQQTSYDVWSSYRNDEGGSVRAYIVNLSNGDGEFFDFDSEQDYLGDLMIHRASGTWQNDYPADVSAVYLLEEWDFSVDGEFLQVEVNDDSSEPRNIMFGIDNFEVDVTLSDGTTPSSFAAGEDWTEVSSINVTLSGSDNYKTRAIEAELSAQFFPRNILSN